VLRAQASTRVAAPSLLILSFIAAVVPCAAQTPPFGLAPVVITGNREPTPLDRIVGDIVVIDAERIRAVERRLRRGPVAPRRRHPAVAQRRAGQSASVLLRGVSASGTLVLVDGVRIGSATLGQVDFAGIALSQIERIEILRGTGVEPVRRRCGRRRGPDHHPSRHRCATPDRARSLSASCTRAVSMRRSAVQAARSTMRRYSARRPAAAFRR
jgi:hypothetical protein